MNKYALSMQIIRSIREKTDTAVLYYSAGGKDGIALLDMLAGVFNKVICYYMYLIPDLDHVQPYIRWAENHYKNVEVRQIEHFQRDYYISCGFFRKTEKNRRNRAGGKRRNRYQIRLQWYEGCRWLYEADALKEVCEVRLYNRQRYGLSSRIVDE